MTSAGGWSPDFSQGALGGGKKSALASLLASPGRRGAQARAQRAAQQSGSFMGLGRLFGGLPGWGDRGLAEGQPTPPSQAVHVYVHFDPDTLKPGVSKVVQGAVRQLVPALRGGGY